MTNILIAIPAYNEEKSIKNIIRQSLNFGEVLVLNDCSSDQTLKICEKERCRVISNHKNIGYSLTIDKAVRYALNNNYEILLFLDGDGQHPAERIPYFISLIESGYSAVVGDRGHMIERPSEKVAANICKFLFNINDIYCGMKAFKLKDYPYQRISNHDNCFGLVHILGYAFNKKPIMNIDIQCCKRLYGQSRLGLSELKNNLKLYRGLVKAIFIAFSQIVLSRIQK